MFGWLFGKSDKRKDELIKKAFQEAKEDAEKLGKWVKHLHEKDQQLFDAVSDIKNDLSSIRSELDSLREAVDLATMSDSDKQLFGKTAVGGKQTAVSHVQELVQTPVQTGNFSDFLKSLSANERLLVFTLLQSEMKLSYEDLALLLGKERSTVRGQINAIKQKSEGLIEEFIEKNGKKRVFIPDQMKEKLSKYAKVRVRGKKNKAESEEKQEKSESLEESDGK